MVVEVQVEKEMVVEWVEKAEGQVVGKEKEEQEEVVEEKVEEVEEGMAMGEVEDIDHW